MYAITDNITYKCATQKIKSDQMSYYNTYVNVSVQKRRRRYYSNKAYARQNAVTYVQSEHDNKDACIIFLLASL